jgi:hypothetical protein
MSPGRNRIRVGSRLKEVRERRRRPKMIQMTPMTILAKSPTIKQKCMSFT